MSVNVIHYVVQGVMLKEEPAGYDRESDLHEYLRANWRQPYEKDRLYVIEDYMSGKWFFIGRILARTGEFEGFDEILEIPNIDDGTIVDLSEKITNLGLGIDDVSTKIKTYVFTHYS